jgi:uncharacterized protein YjdB
MNARRARAFSLAAIAAAACLTACAQTTTAPAPAPALTAPAAGGTTGPSLSRIDVTVAAATVTSGAAQPLHAVGVFDDGSHADVTDLVTWQSSAPRVAIVDVAGATVTLYGGDAGAADVTATLGAIHGVAHVTVATALRSITVSPGVTRIAPCGTRQLTAIASFSDGSQSDVTTLADWSSSDGTVAAASNGDGSRGLLLAMAPGTVTITARWAGVAGTLTLAANSSVPRMIAVSPTNLSVTAGDAIGFTATATYCDDSTEDVTLSAAWNSSAPDVATITDIEAGMYIANATHAGTTLISAQLDDLSDAIELQVAPPTLRSIFIDMPASAEGSTDLAVGASAPLTATAEYSDGSSVDVTAAVTWSSSDNQLATVSSAGVVTAVASGEVTIMVAMDGHFGSLALTVTP